MVVLLFTLLVGPVVGANASLHEQLIAPAGVACQRLAQGAEGHEPQTGGNLTRGAAFILACIVVAQEAEACEGRIVLGAEFWVAGEVADSCESEAVHGDRSSD